MPHYRAVRRQKLPAANAGHLEVIYLFFEGAAITALRVQAAL